MAIEFHRDGPWELPEGWVWARAGDVLPLEYGKGLPERQRDGSGEVPVYGSSGIVGTHTASLIDEPCLIVARKGTVGAIFEETGPSWPIDTVYFARNSAALDRRYAYWFFSFCRLDRLDQSTAVPSVSRDNYNKFLVPIAPAAEQRRIVARIDELFTEIADGEASLARARDDLDTWRRALLKSAVTGELTREWREHNHPNETGLEVLARVADARIGYKATKARGRALIVDALDEDALPQIPETWTWSHLGEIGDVVGGVTVDKKRRPSDPVTIPYLRVANVQRGHLDLSEIKTISVERNAATSLRLEAGDILLNEGGDRDKIGRGWIWNGEIDNCIHQNHVFRVRLFDRRLNPYFISHYANEMGRRFFVEKGKQTTNLASISLSKISQLPVPIPPIAEMNEAIRLLDKMLVTAVDVEAELAAASISSAGRQSILKAAFEGRLVEQDPRDEPADRLLARLSERAEEPPGPRRPRGKRRDAATLERI